LPELSDQKIRKQKPPQPDANQVALVFRPPINTPPPARKELQTENLIQAGGEIGTPSIAGDEKYSYLGLIRESNDQEWLYLKDRETGRVISIREADMVSANQEYCVVDIGGIHYFIRRN
jgi:hypothetical protein